MSKSRVAGLRRVTADRHGNGLPAAHATSWWDVHDRARRDAILLLIVASTVCAAYIATVIAVVLIALRVGQYGPWRGIDRWQHQLGPLGIAGVGLALIGIASAVIAVDAAAGLARRVLRRSRAHAPALADVEHVQRLLSGFALGVGLGEPRLSVVDDPAVNALAAGRPRAPQIVLTTGSLALAPTELEALCARTVASVSDRAAPLAGAAANVILDADWCTRAIWGVAVLPLLASVVGMPPEVSAIAVLAVVALVVITKPLVMLASGAIVRLLDDTAELIDLETVRVTNKPAALANLMLDTIEHRAPVHCTWDIAHLWFDPETTTSNPSWYLPSIRPLASADSRRTRVGLLKRASVLVDLAHDDHRLRDRLARAEQVVASSD